MAGYRAAVWCAAFLSAAPAMGQELTGATDRAVRDALRLLPDRPAHIAVVDRPRAMQLHPALTSRAEAFVVAGSATIYLIRQGDTLQHAAVRSGIFEYALAIIIWHEMAHVAGATEREAQEREEALWEQYVADGRVDRTRGTEYLVLLRRRHTVPATQ